MEEKIMPDLTSCHCVKCVYRKVEIYNNPCKDCCDSTKNDYPSFKEDFSVKILSTDDYGLGIPEFRICD